MAKGKRSVTAQPAPGIPVTRGSGNVFADLGFEDPEELQVKAALTRQIANRIKAFGLTQVQAGSRLGISQPDVSKLMRSRYTGYSVGRSSRPVGPRHASANLRSITTTNRKTSNSRRLRPPGTR